MFLISVSLLAFCLGCLAREAVRLTARGTKPTIRLLYWGVGAASVAASVAFASQEGRSAYQFGSFSVTWLLVACFATFRVAGGQPGDGGGRRP